MSTEIEQVAEALEQAMVDATQDRSQFSRDVSVVLARAAVRSVMGWFKDTTSSAYDGFLEVAQGALHESEHPPLERYNLNDPITSVLPANDAVWDAIDRA